MNKILRCVFLWVATGLVAFSATFVCAQDDESLGRSLGLTRSAKSLPLWTKPPDSASRRLVSTVKSSQDGVMLVGNSKSHGTAFVISCKHRLLATNAHVADIMHSEGSMLAIRNGTAETYKVDKVWYHPGVRRKNNDTLSLRSQRPEDGSVDPRSPDVAVLHIADGPDLTVEFPLATAEEVENCFAQPVGMLGYPGHDTEGWPGLGEKAQATLREGIICRLSDFYGRVSIPPGELQFAQHSMTSWFGFSGSPIFLTNGHVVALNNSASAVKRGEHQVELAYGVRVDCLWELLAHHKLDDLVSIPVPKSQLLLDRYERPDPEEEKFRRAKQLAREGNILFNRQLYSDAITKYNEAIQLTPGYAGAYGQRAIVYSRYITDKYPTPGSSLNEEIPRYYKYVVADVKKYMEMNPNDPGAILGSVGKL